MVERDPETSSDRIERKRAHDREAQRASRAKTKAYIAHLEKTVADLTKSNGNSTSKYLAQHSSKQAQEIEGMHGLFNKIRQIISEAGKCDASVALALPPAIVTDPDASFDTPGAWSEGESNSNSNSHGGIPYGANPTPPKQDEWVTDVLKATDPTNEIGEAVATCATKLSAEFGGSLVCDPNDPHYFLRLNDAIAKVEQTARDDLTTREEDEDILIRAIVHGWDACEKVHYLDLVWRLFRHADETLWNRIRPIDRIAHFWQMRSTMLNKIRPKNQQRRVTPSFMSPTPRQKADALHPSIADYFAWPQVRDSLCMSDISKVSGNETIIFADSFRFMWRYELRDAYMKNLDTGMYSFSEGFLRGFNSLSSFRILQGQESTSIPRFINPQVSIRDEDRIVECDVDTPETDLYEKDASPSDQFIDNGVMLPTDENSIMNNPLHDQWLPTFEPLMPNDPNSLGWPPMYPFPVQADTGLVNWPSEM